MKTNHHAGHAIAAVAALLGLLQAPCHAQKSTLPDVPVEELKRIYLACDRASSSGRVALPAIQHCSVVYEELKSRAFEGDFEKLLAWSRSRHARLTDQ